MRFILVSGLIMTLTVCFFTIGLADELPSTNGSDEKAWEGIWTDLNYSVSIVQNGSEISGIARSNNIGLNDPFLLSGIVTEDGRTFHGIMKESGTMILNISDDKMSYSANGTVDPIDNSSEPYHYTSKGTRNGTSINPDNIWSGEWNAANTTAIINQEGRFVTGKYRPEFLYPIFWSVGRKCF